MLAITASIIFCMNSVAFSSSIFGISCSSCRFFGEFPEVSMSFSEVGFTVFPCLFRLWFVIPLFKGHSEFYCFPENVVY